MKNKTIKSEIMVTLYSIFAISCIKMDSPVLLGLALLILWLFIDDMTIMELKEEQEMLINRLMEV